MCDACANSELHFEVLGPQEIVNAAHNAKAKKERWHFHVLAPDCTFNPQPGKYAFVIELTDQQRTIGFFSDERPIEVNKDLLALLHGADALANKPVERSSLSQADQDVLEKIQNAVTGGVIWHHHMMFPDCALNSSNKWRIVVEIDGTVAGTLDFDVEPNFLLNRIERLYFGVS